MKKDVIRALESIDDEGNKSMQIAKLVAELKVVLLADVGHKGLNETSRKRAWAMVNEIGKIVRKDL
jgi:hypothetical protein